MGTWYVLLLCDYEVKSIGKDWNFPRIKSLGMCLQLCRFLTDFWILFQLWVAKKLKILSSCERWLYKKRYCHSSHRLQGGWDEELWEASYSWLVTPCILGCLLSDVYLMEEDCPLCNTAAKVGRWMLWSWPSECETFPWSLQRVPSMDYNQWFVVLWILEVDECGLAYFFSLQGNWNWNLYFTIAN